MKVGIEVDGDVFVHTGGCGFVEHPQVATWLEGAPCPSIWRLKVVRETTSLACLSVVSFDEMCVWSCRFKANNAPMGAFSSGSASEETRSMCARCESWTRSGKRPVSDSTSHERKCVLQLNKALSKCIFFYVAQQKLRGLRKTWLLYA